MKPKVIIPLFFCAVLALLASSCDFSTTPGSASPEHQVSFQDATLPSVAITADGGQAPRSLDRPTAHPRSPGASGIEIWVVPTERGVDSPIAPYNLERILKYSPDVDGSYNITAVPDSTFVLVSVDVSGAVPKPIGVISLRVDGKKRILEFPKASKILNSIDFGQVVFSNTDVGDSFKDLSQNAAAFSPQDLLLLQDAANFSNSSRMVLNMLRNMIQKNSSKIYTEKVNIELSKSSLPSGGLQVLESSAKLPIKAISVSFYSDDSTTRARLYYPDGVTPVGSMEFHNYGSNSATKHSAGFSLADFLLFAKPGDLFPLISESGTVLAKFDLSASIVADESGVPLFPIPFPEYSISGSTASSVAFNWQYFSMDGSTVARITSATLLDALIGNREFYLDASDGTTFMFRSYSPANPSAGSLSGDLVQASFNPAPRNSGGVIRNIGYMFGLYGLLIR